MSTRLVTRIGLLADEERRPDALDVTAFHEPTVGALVRTKGSLFLLAQVTGTDPALRRAAALALEDVEREYYYDLSAGSLRSLDKALKAANRRLYHRRGRLGIPRRAGISVIGVAIRGREAHVAKLGPASAVIVREGRMYELPPPPAVHEEDPRVRQRRVAATLGEALEIEPYSWEGQLAPNDRIALVSRNLAQTVGVDDLKRTLGTLRPSQAVEHLQHLFAIRGGGGSDGLLVVEVAELPITSATHHPEPVHPAEPLAGLPDQSPVPLADAIGSAYRRVDRAGDELKAAIGRGILRLLNILFAFVPRPRPELRRVERTSIREEGRRRRRGLAGMVAVALLLALGTSVANLPSAHPTEAIPRALVAREAIMAAEERITAVEERVDGDDLVERDPERAEGLLNEAYAELERAAGAGIRQTELESLRVRVDRKLDQLHRVTRLAELTTVANLTATFTDVDPQRMVVASDGSIWLIEVGRGRVVRVDPGGEIKVLLRAGQAPETGGGRTAAAPWLIATAATDVVVIDRQRQAWRFDLGEQLPRVMALNGAESLDAGVELLAALQHRPPLEIFTLYLLGTDGQILKWTPPAVLPVNFPDPPEPYLTEESDLPAAEARDLIVDANLWLLHADTVTRVNFGRPLPQEDYRLDPPPDGEVRAALDYRLLDGATVGDRELFYVYDAANTRVLAFQRADGAFVRQWMAPRRGAESDLLDEVRSLVVGSVADGPPAAYLLTDDRVVRIVLE